MTFSKILYLVIGIALILAVPLWSTKVAINFTKLASDFNFDITLNHTENNRFTFDEDWSGNTLSISNIKYTTEKVTESASLIDSLFQVKSLTGTILFDLKQKYLVNRYTNHNLPGQTDTIGSAYFMFPHHTEKKDYFFWSGTFGKPFVMKYIKNELRNGLTVYHFQGQDNAIDDTEGYSFLPLVPEKYRALSNAKIDVYIEPVSGMMVDYVDKGVSYYSDSESHRLWDISQWSNQMKPESVVILSNIAVKTRNKIILHEIAIPGFILILGSYFLYKSVYRRNKVR